MYAKHDTHGVQTHPSRVRGAYLCALPGFHTLPRLSGPCSGRRIRRPPGRCAGPGRDAARTRSVAGVLRQALGISAASRLEISAASRTRQPTGSKRSRCIFDVSQTSRIRTNRVRALPVPRRCGPSRRARGPSRSCRPGERRVNASRARSAEGVPRRGPRKGERQRRASPVGERPQACDGT